MKFIQWTIALCMALFAQQSMAGDFQAGITVGTAMLSGDNTSSDMGIAADISGDMFLTPYLSLGLTGGIQRMSGTAKVTDRSSVFYGSHPYETTLLMGGAALRLTLPSGTIRPYLSLAAGESFWVPGKNDDIATLPTKRQVSWAVSPYISIGAGISLPMGTSWSLEAGGTGMFFASDELDNVDNGYVSGGSGNNDYAIQAGITLVYRFGGSERVNGGAAPETQVPERAPLTPESQEPSEPLRPVPTETVPPERQEPQPTPMQPEPQRSPIETIEAPLPEPPGPDTSGTVTTTPPAATEPEPAVPAQEPAPTRTSAPIQTDRRSYLVHVASVTTNAEANARAETLRGAGYRTVIRSVDRGDIGIWLRVYVGPYAVRDEADQTAQRLIQSGLSDYAAVIEDTGE